ncbi:hypothetical protein Ga0100231_009495 [Opitutaceae bacterium TAV4]|nr:hypothetical protein Ga0100231_009495 [Opitutaceae bacterium TAV4]RRJ98610.1 hypothetical protein Ga0100230_009595 [Opitutaceae bacterium TAV3]
MRPIIGCGWQEVGSCWLPAFQQLATNNWQFWILSLVTFDYTILALSIILLWIPRPCMRWGRLGGGGRPAAPVPAPSSSQGTARRRRISTTRVEFALDYRLNTLRELKDPHNWIDFFRALVGGFGLFVTGITGTDLVDLPLAQSGPFIAAQIVVVIAAVLFQMLRFDKGVIFYAPVFFIQGLMFGLVDWRVGLLTMLGTWTIIPLLHTPGPFLSVVGVVAAVFGALLKVHLLYVFTALGVALWPVFWSIMLEHRLVANMERKHLRLYMYQKTNDANE